jgi:predicted Zn-dependent protease with MMP-like domain
MDKDKFEQIILNTLKELPDEFKEKIKNLEIVIEENDVQPELKYKKSNQIKYTLGLYQGVPATKKPGKTIIMPDKITIYKKALEKVSNSDSELERNIKKVVLHELGHYFGLDEKKLKDLGY